MAGGSSSTGSASNQARIASSTTSDGKKRVSLTRIRRDSSVERDDETSVSEYSESDSHSDGHDQHPAASKQKRARSRSRSPDHAASSRPGKYTILRSETRQVEAAVIKSKWRPTTAAAQVKVKAVLSLAERPIINGNPEPERRKEAQASLAAISRIIESRLPRMPFPPDTKEWHFDYEAILRNNQDLERQLAAAKHSSVLIQAEIEKEQQLLEEAEAELEELEKDTRAQEKARSQRERNTPQMWTTSEDLASDSATSIGFQESTAPHIDSIATQGDAFPFVEELYDHLDSIQTNIDQVAGLSEGLDRVSGPLTRLVESTDT